MKTISKAEASSSISNFGSSSEGERAVLCALLTNSAAAPEIFASLTSQDFSTVETKTLFNIAGELFMAGKKIDLVTMSSALKKWPQIKVNLPKMFDDFSGDYPIHIEMLREFKHKRKILELFEETKEKLANGTVGEVLSGLISSLSEITQDKRNRPVLLSQAVLLSTKRIESAIDKKHVTGIPTGYRDFDAEIGGVQPGEVMIIGARPNVGKSALVAGIAIGAARTGVVAMICSAEMEVVEIGTRMLASESGVENINLRRGKLFSGDVEKVIEASGKLSHLPVYIYDDTNWDVIKFQIRAIKSFEPKLGMVLLDYVGLIEVAKHFGEKRYQELGRITKEAKKLAKELQIAVVIAAQLNRIVEREKKPPDLADLRESGDLEQDSDIVTFLHRPKPDVKTEVVWYVRKNRNGPTSRFKLRFNPAEVRFYDWQEVDFRYDPGRDNDE